MQPEEQLPDFPYAEAPVQHLIELGYVDPDAVALRDAALRQQLEADLQQARALYQRGDFQQAAYSMARLATEDPSWVSPRQLLPEIYYRTGQIEQAQAELNWLAEHAIEHPRLALISGAIAIGRRNYSSAIDELEYARHLEPSLPGVDTLLGTALLRLRRLDAAETAFHKAIERKSDDAAAFDGLAAICLQRSDFEAAASLALQSLEHDMQLFTAHCHLGLALAEIGHPNQAITAFETAARISPNRAAPYYWMARVAAQFLHDEPRAKAFRSRGTEIIRDRQR